MRKKHRPLAVDLFAGAGGMSLGFEQAGFDVVAAVEIDPIHCLVHQFNFPQTTILCRNVADLSGSTIREQAALSHQEIDVVFGGSPCQGFSLMGKRALDDPRNALVRHFLRLVTELAPKYFVLENVKGLTLGPHRQFLAEVISAFQAHGYRVQENYQVLNAAHYGVPQNRERLFLLGGRADLPLPAYPHPTTHPPGGPAVGLTPLPHTPTVWEAIADLPDIEQYPELWHQDTCRATYGEPRSTYAAVMRGQQRWADDWAYERTWNPAWLTASGRTRHSEASIQRFRETPVGQVEPISRFFRLDPNGLCNTLRAGTPSNRGAFTSPRPIHPFQPRCITVREAARLHSFPDWFRFHHTKWHGFRQIGNSVPPLLAKAIAQEIIRVLPESPLAHPGQLAAGQDGTLHWTMTQAAQFFGVAGHPIAPRTRKAVNV
ncbi:MAG: DNA cytosine methyltransferase [Pseudanabaenaceae cyanobacterium]